MGFRIICEESGLPPGLTFHLKTQRNRQSQPATPHLRMRNAAGALVFKKMFLCFARSGGYTQGLVLEKRLFLAPRSFSQRQKSHGIILLEGVGLRTGPL